LRQRLEALAAERRRFGYRRLHVLLAREGIAVNHKRLRRIYCQANLQVRKRIKRRVALGSGNPPPLVSRPNERWSLDFIHAVLRDGRRMRILTIVDDDTREALALELDTSLPSPRVIRALDELGTMRGYPDTIVLDNGAALTSLTMLRWAPIVTYGCTTSRRANPPKTPTSNPSTANSATNASTSTIRLP